MGKSFSQKKNLNKFLTPILAILLCQAAGFIGAIFTFSSIPTWYASLIKPFFAPPNSVFGPVWTTLYTLMGISLYLIWMSKTKNKSKALKVFYIQLGLNTLWSIIFFGFRAIGLAFIEIIFLWIFIYLSIKEFRKISNTASNLLLPYLAWVSFASLLNLSFWIMNP